MLGLDDISERLFIRSQEAVLQLELWIRRQQQLSEFDHEDQGDRLTDQYDLYMAQLNSLCVRSEYIRGKLNGNCDTSIANEQNYIKDLVYEFQDITIKLNELVRTQREQVTPSSRHSTESSSSFQPRPLKITQRHEAEIALTRKSPTKVNGGLRNVTFVEESVPEKSSPFRCASLPGSPNRVSSPSKPLRVAKSYDTGLNRNAKARRRKRKDDEILSIFKEKQRLSITFCDDIEEESSSASDQNTVISTGPASPSFSNHHDGKAEKPPMRRCYSHESILSKHSQPVFPVKCPSFFLFPTANRPSMKSVRVSSAPVISTMEGKTNSKDLLSSFISNELGTNNDNNRLSKGFLWNLFRYQTANQNGNSCESALQRHSLVGTTSERRVNGLRTAKSPRGVYSSCSRLLVDSHQSNVLPPVPQHVNDERTVCDELQEALNTELLL